MATKEESKKFTIEQSEIQAGLIINVFQTAILMDLDYLKSAQKEIERQYNINMSLGAVLDGGGFNLRDKKLRSQCERIEALINLIIALTETQEYVDEAQEGELKRNEAMKALGLGL